MSYLKSRVSVPIDGGDMATLLIFRGDVSTRDGEIVNKILERLPVISDSDFRHYIITSPTDDDGAPLKTIIGTLADAEREAQRMLDDTFGIVNGKFTVERSDIRARPSGRRELASGS